MERKLTLIVPVYNTEQTRLEVFFESLKKQTDNNFKLIIVDDGSDQKTKIFIKKICCKFQNATLVEQDHNGVSSARNTAIDLVETEYVAFADSDDIIPSNFIKEAYYYIRHYCPDIIFGCIKYKPEVQLKRQSLEKPFFTTNRDELHEIKKSLLDIRPRKLSFQLLGSPCGKIYKTEIVKKIKFDDNIKIFEDQIFNYQYINQVANALVLPNVWYVYVQYLDSSIHVSNNKNSLISFIPYLKKAKELDANESKDIFYGMKRNYLKAFYTIIVNDIINKKDFRLNSVKRIMEKAMKNDVIKDALEKPNFDLVNYNVVDRLFINLVTNRFYYPAYILILVAHFLGKL